MLPKTQVSTVGELASFVFPLESMPIGLLPDTDRFSITTWLFRGPLSFEESRNFTTGPELTELESRTTIDPNEPPPVISAPSPHVSKLAPCKTDVNPPFCCKAVVQYWKEILLKSTCWLLLRIPTAPPIIAFYFPRDEYHDLLKLEPIGEGRIKYSRHQKHLLWTLGSNQFRCVPRNSSAY